MKLSLLSYRNLSLSSPSLIQFVNREETQTRKILDPQFCLCKWSPNE